MPTLSQFNLGCCLWDFRYFCKFSNPINNAYSWGVFNKSVLCPEFSGKVQISIPFCILPNKPIMALGSNYVLGTHHSCFLFCFKLKLIGVTIVSEVSTPVFLVWNLWRQNGEMFLNIFGSEPKQLPFLPGCRVPYVKWSTRQAIFIAHPCASVHTHSP